MGRPVGCGWVQQPPSWRHCKVPPYDAAGLGLGARMGVSLAGRVLWLLEWARSRSGAGFGASSGRRQIG
jgi:hypothetical protein